MLSLKEYSELSHKELIDRIQRSRAEKNAVILGHNYQREDIQLVCDHLGDSLGLSRIAADTDADVIVFCGVMFMAETAKILSPHKKVYIPEKGAGCPLAAGANMEDVIELKKKNPEHIVISYVNTTAEVKAVTDICCTSGNALEVVKSVGDAPVIFLPDINLGTWVKETLGKDNMILWEGGCYVHSMIRLEHIENARAKFPDATIMVHPEVPYIITKAADEVGSTSAMFNYVRDHDEHIILGTEIGLIERIRHEMPEKRVSALKTNAICFNMKQTTLPKLARCLELDFYEVTLDEEIRASAENAIRRMIEIG
ncbi:MAG: quinolinate synthase NadA [bacterium]